MADVCGAPHPTEYGLACTRPPGTNAYNEDRNENVHVHNVIREDGAPFRWEDEE